MAYITTMGVLIMETILRWAKELKRRLKVGGPYVLWLHFSDTTSQFLSLIVGPPGKVDGLMERVCHLTNKISGNIMHNKS